MRQGPVNISKVEESPFHNTRLNQGRIERFILDSIRECSDLEVERSVIAESLEYDESLDNDPDAYPISVSVRAVGEDDLNSPSGQQMGSGSDAIRTDLHINKVFPDDWADLAQREKVNKTQIETIKAKYLIGCDGAHSWTRKQLNIPVEGSNTDHIWLVILLTR